jgi:hypothetical protein
MTVYTFFCQGADRAPSLVDLQDLPSEAYREHALSLLREHASAAAVEVWQEDNLLDIIESDSVPESLAPDNPP